MEDKNIQELGDRDYGREIQRIFRDLALDAKEVLQREMYNCRDTKLRIATAKDVLVFSGAKAQEVAPTVPVMIKDSQVQLLVQVAKEVTNYEG